MLRYLKDILCPEARIKKTAQIHRNLYAEEFEAAALVACMTCSR
jgi:hypothetical protein